MISFFKVFLKANLWRDFVNDLVSLNSLKSLKNIKLCYKLVVKDAKFPLLL